MPTKINDMNYLSNHLEDRHIKNGRDNNRFRNKSLGQENSQISPQIGLTNYGLKHEDNSFRGQYQRNNDEHVLNNKNGFDLVKEREFDPKTCKYRINGDQTNTFDCELLEFNQYQQNGTTGCLKSVEGHVNNFRDDRQRIIERNKKYLKKKQLKEIPCPLPNDIYKYREPRKGKICARSFNDFQKPGIKLLPYSTPKFDSTHEMMEYYKSGKGQTDMDSSIGVVSRGYSKSGSISGSKGSKMSSIRASDENAGAFLKGMIDFKCHDIVGTLAKMAVIKGDLLDLLAVKMNARAMYDDTYYNVTQHGDRLIGSKKVYFTDLYKPIKGGESTKVVEIGNNRSTMNDPENMTTEEYHRNMIHSYNSNANIEDESYNSLVQDRLENGSIPEYNRVYHEQENGYEVDTSNRFNYHGDIGHSNRNQNGVSSFRIKNNSLLNSENDEFDGYVNASINGCHGFRSKNGYYNDADAQVNENSKYVDTSERSSNKYYNSAHTLERSSTQYYKSDQSLHRPYNGYDASIHLPDREHDSVPSFKSCISEPYSISKSKSSNQYRQRKPELSSSLKSWSQPEFRTASYYANKDNVDGLIASQSSTSLPFQSSNMLDSESKLTRNYEHKYKETSQSGVSPTNLKTRSAVRDKHKTKHIHGSYDIDCLLDTSNSSDSILSHPPQLVSHSNSMLENGYSYSQRSSLYNSCDDALRKPSYGQLMNKYDKSGNYLTSSSTLSNITKEDYCNGQTANIAYKLGGTGLTDNPSALWYPYELGKTREVSFFEEAQQCYDI